MDNRHDSLLRQSLEKALDYINRVSLGHDIGSCVHFANQAEAELRSVLDSLAAQHAGQPNDGMIRGWGDGPA